MTHTTVNMRHMVNVHRAIKANYLAQANNEQLLITGAESLQRINAAFVQAIAETDECKLLKHKRQIILDAIEDGDHENIHLDINAAAIALGDDRMITFRNLHTAFHALSKATTFAEYSKHRTHYLYLRNIFTFRCNNIINNASQRLNAALNWAEYYNKLIYAATRMPKSSTAKSSRKLAYKQHLAAYTDHATGIYNPWQPSRTVKYPFHNWVCCMRFNNYVDYLNRHAPNHW